MSHQDLKNQIQKSIDHLKQEFATLQIGRASASLVDSVEVEVYGASSPLKQVANISCPDAKTIKVEPWDKSLVGDIEKAIQEANIGINPQNMGESLFLPIPPMTEERRQEIVKKVHQLTEEAKISVRNARQEAMKFIKLQKDENEVSEDQQKDLESEAQEIVDKSNKEIEELAHKKEQEILTV
jgi:ribosome recycling factor